MKPSVLVFQDFHINYVETMYYVVVQYLKYQSVNFGK